MSRVSKLPQPAAEKVVIVITDSKVIATIIQIVQRTKERGSDLSIFIGSYLTGRTEDSV